jgi:hypothetical protein
MIDATTAADSGSIEEVFRDVTIDTDGLVASVNFDYSILRNGEEAHWGREMWHLVHTEDGSAVQSVMVGGRMVLENRRLVNVDLAKLAREAERARERLERLNRDNRSLYERLEPIVGSFCPGLAKAPLHINRYAS